jgi:hypothetical protein
VTDEPASPETDEVRRLLAEARHTEPMPADVAARLDDVLTGLAAGEPKPAEVVPLEARRRRRAAAGWLVAAAAVVVGAVAVAPHLHNGSAGSGTAAEDSARGQSSNTGNTGQAPSPNAAAPSSQNSSPGKAPRIAAGALVIRAHHFPADARAARQQLLAGRYSQLEATAPSPCGVAPSGGHLVPAEFRHAPAALVFRRARAGSQVVELYVCGQAAPVRSTTLPAP